MRSSLCVLLVLWAAACSDPNSLPDATLTNIERTETLYSLIGTPVATPSGYALDGGRQVRTDQSDAFDFAYNVEPDGRHVFLPRAALGIDTSNTLNPGFLARTESFEAIKSAPSNGYVDDRAIPIAIGERYIVRSRVTCTSIGVPKYAKLEILGFDEVARTVSFRILIDDNCGFRGLEPGLPDS
jgi:hypothetical protein